VVAIVAIFQFGTGEAQQWLKAEYAEHKAQLAALQGGGWPEGRSGQRIAALAERLGEPGAAHVRRYWEVLCWLVVEAEETLLEQSDGNVEFDRTKIAAAFDELDTLHAALGTAGFAQLERLLPFSRNDYWELSELKERVQRD